ncbi:MAG TPA: mechanosensitive ion channel domain-containing protein [Verrucomicrobiae bacterium]|nr:mechanosensitive ion channel domain-containing protein [Verrucomicrobiae bacterium]
MNTTNPPPDSPWELVHDTIVGRIYSHFSHHESSTGTRILLIVVLAIIVHVLVKITRHLSEWLIHKSQAQKNPLGFVTQQPKFITLTRLIVSGITFVIYFFAIGLILQEFGVNLTAYLASASVVGLAISFGSQGLVQDVVIGLTLIFSDAMDIGDMVEIYCSTTVIGRVEEIGLRFTVLRNFYNQVVFIPNRTIANVSRFPHGGVYAYADIQIPAEADRDRAVGAIRNVARGMWAQFAAIILSEPEIGPVETARGGNWDFVRVHFKIWPGQGGLIETTFRQQMVNAMKTFNPNYTDWQVAVTYRNLTAVKR